MLRARGRAVTDELLERSEPLAQLARLLDKARTGAGSLVLVTGEAGIGRTALLSRFAAQVSPPVRLLRGWCDPLFTPRRAGPLLDIAWAEGSGLSPPAPGEDAVLAFDRALGGPEAPTLLIVEDVHWAELPTLDALKQVGRRIGQRFALIVLSFRDEEVGPPLRATLGELPQRNTVRIALQGLSPEAVDRLAGRPARELHAIAGGNPSYVTALLAEPGALVPAAIRDSVIARASKLRQPARDLLELAAVARWPIALPWIERAGDGFDGLDVLLASGWLTEDAGQIAFRHEVVRRAIEGGIEKRRAALLHARWLAALRPLESDPAMLPRLANHAGGALDRTATLRFAPRAAALFSSEGRNAEAAAMISWALRHADEGAPGERAELYARRSREHLLAGDAHAALLDAEHAHELWRAGPHRDREADSLRTLALLAREAGRLEAARAYAQKAMAASAALADGRRSAWAFAMRAEIHLREGAHEAAIADARLALPDADAELQARALEICGAAQVLCEDGDGFAVLEQTLAIARDHRLDGQAARSFLALAGLSAHTRRLDHAAHWIESGLAFARERGLASCRRALLAIRAGVRLSTGDWSGAEEDAATAAEGPANRGRALVVAGLLRARRGRSGARPLLEEAAATAQAREDRRLRVEAACAIAELAWLSEDPVLAGSAASRLGEVAPLAIDRWSAADLAVWLTRCTGVTAGGPATVFGGLLAGDWAAAAVELGRLGCRYEAALAVFHGEDPAAWQNAIGELHAMGAHAAAARLRSRLPGPASLPQRPGGRTQSRQLTPRERQVLVAVARGLSNAQIAGQFFVAKKTVAHHVSAILAKLGVRTRGAAVAEAYRAGLLDPSE